MERLGQVPYITLPPKSVMMFKYSYGAIAYEITAHPRVTAGRKISQTCQLGGDDVETARWIHRVLKDGLRHAQIPDDRPPQVRNGRTCLIRGRSASRFIAKIRM
jgi:hypothetical protein